MPLSIPVATFASHRRVQREPIHLRAQRLLHAPWGKELVVQVGRSREGQLGEEVEVIHFKLRAVAKDQGLHSRLLEILRKP